MHSHLIKNIEEVSRLMVASCVLATSSHISISPTSAKIDIESKEHVDVLLGLDEIYLLSRGQSIEQK